MLAACVASGWETSNYLDPDHPLQRMNRENVACFGGIAPDAVRIGVDGCSAPVFAVPLASAARIFANVTNRNSAAGVSEARRVASRRVCAALAAKPEMIGGTKRLDTDVIRVTEGRIISKVGAEGLWCAGVSGADLGIAVKCEDGTAAAAYWVGLALLKALGALDGREWDLLARHHDPVRRNHRHTDVGVCEVRLPGGLG
jgi:L-asparaginase II